MEENIEVKDVQKTEYLDKNGLDMLWAKVKENTHNQVEAESNRATIQETRIIETKADKSELGNYAPNTALEALEKKISANTAAIGNKQNAGNYLHYETLNNEGYYEIPSVCIPGSGGSTKTNISSDEIRVSNGDLGYTFITGDRIRYYHDEEGSLGFDLNSDGIELQGGDNNHVLTSGGSTIDIRDYAKKTEIPTAATKESLGVVKVGDGINVTDGTISVDTTAIGVGNYIPYESIDDKTYVMKYNEGILFDQNSGNISIKDGEIQIKGPVRKLSLTPSFIWLEEISVNRESLLVELDENGLRLRNGDNKHVLTSYGSTIDITQYALKSVYNEKIAALEARIAALEAKHTEAA